MHRLVPSQFPSYGFPMQRYRRCMGQFPQAALSPGRGVYAGYWSHRPRHRHHYAMSANSCRLAARRTKSTAKDHPLGYFSYGKLVNGPYFNFRSSLLSLTIRSVCIASLLRIVTLRNVTSDLPCKPSLRSSRYPLTGIYRYDFNRRIMVPLRSRTSNNLRLSPNPPATSLKARVDPADVQSPLCILKELLHYPTY